MSEKNKILSVAKPKKLKKVNVPSATEKKKVGELGNTSKNSIKKKKKQTKNLKNARGGSLKKSFPDSLRKKSSSKRALLNLSDLYQEKKNKATINKKKRGTAPDTIEEQTNVLTKVVFKKRKRVGRGRATGYGKTSGRGIRDRKLAQDTVRREVLKADKCRFIVAYQSVGLLHYHQRNIRL